MKLPSHVGSEETTEPTYAKPEPIAAMGSGGGTHRRDGFRQGAWVPAQPEPIAAMGSPAGRVGLGPVPPS